MGKKPQSHALDEAPLRRDSTLDHFEQDLFGKPVSTFPDHAPVNGS
ncbi:hypothetical protein H8A99_32115 [Bradyrhizobium sp. Arg68]|nr:hypothetical protein [Bradyrhizobium ivorense]MCC8940959.1 hypothetical protein [Bradyrhizobium ivorense]